MCPALVTNPAGRGGAKAPSPVHTRQQAAESNPGNTDLAASCPPLQPAQAVPDSSCPTQPGRERHPPHLGCQASESDPAAQTDLALVGVAGRLAAQGCASRGVVLLAGQAPKPSAGAQSQHCRLLRAGPACGTPRRGAGRAPRCSSFAQGTCSDPAQLLEQTTQADFLSSTAPGCPDADANGLDAAAGA